MQPYLQIVIYIFKFEFNFLIFTLTANEPSRRRWWSSPPWLRPWRDASQSRGHSRPQVEIVRWDGRHGRHRRLQREGQARPRVGPGNPGRHNRLWGVWPPGEGARTARKGQGRHQAAREEGEGPERTARQGSQRQIRADLHAMLHRVLDHRYRQMYTLLEHESADTRGKYSGLIICSSWESSRIFLRYSWIDKLIEIKLNRQLN